MAARYKGFIDDKATIHILVDRNPKQPETAAHRKFAFLMRYDGRSVQEFVDGAGRNRHLGQPSEVKSNTNWGVGELRWSIAHRFVAVEPPHGDGSDREAVGSFATDDASDPLTPFEAERILLAHGSYRSWRMPTERQYIHGFVSENGVQLALQRKRQTKCASCFLGVDPRSAPLLENIEVREYLPDDPRIHTLNAHAPELTRGHKAWLVKRLSRQQLNSLLDWYALLLPDDAQHPVQDSFYDVAEELDRDGYFDPQDPEDARKKIQQAVVVRQGQPAFRAELLQTYEGRCAISGCEVTDVLEAAHIIPYKGEYTNTPKNGLLLRSDLHTLMDRGLLAIHPERHLVLVAARARCGEYAEFHGKRIRSSASGRGAPANEYLRVQYDAAEWAQRAFAELEAQRHERRPSSQPDQS